MTDAQRLKESVDLREWIERDLNQRPVSRGPGASNFKCPFHHERKGASLAVYHDRWQCFGTCNTGGDLYDWIAKRENLDIKESFREIYRLAGGDPDDRPLERKKVPRPVRESRPPAEPPSVLWQEAGRKVVTAAQTRLHSSVGQVAWKYLTERRGLQPETIEIAQIGYIPLHESRWISAYGLLIPTHSVTLPWFAGGHLWGIKCRRLDGGDIRYVQVRATDENLKLFGDANITQSLYGVDQIVAGRPILVVEGEFNALSVWQTARHVAIPVSLGASGQTLDSRWFVEFLTAPTILTWFDRDGAGQKGINRLAGLSKRVRPIALPDEAGKDINDWLVASTATGDSAAIERWLKASLESVERDQLNASDDAPPRG